MHYKEDWSYNNIRQWARKNRYCAGRSQSPIDLRFKTSHHDRRLRPLSLVEQHSQGRL